jgi:diamine N-acetyltransferase
MPESTDNLNSITAANYFIRPACIDDIATIQAIAHETWPIAYGDILSAAQIRYMLTRMYAHETLANQMQDAANGQQFLLIANAMHVAGFAAYSVNQPAAAIAKLHKLYCLPTSQGLGLGRKLVNAVIANCVIAKQKTLCLNVNKFNRAKIFYERLGFKMISEEVIDIGEGYVMDDFVLERTLNN